VEVVVPPPEKDRDSFREVFVRFFPRLTSYFRSFGFSPSDAEDLSQGTLLNVYKTWEDYRGEGSLDAWIFAAARNMAYDEWRRRARSKDGGAPEETIPDSGPSVEELASGREDLSRAVEALRSLPAGMRACLLLQVQEGLSYQEIAERLSLSAHTVKVQIWNARRRLRERLSKAS
jgi:RNA polymerase sigma-70 factor (ECF subfamily)